MTGLKSMVGRFSLLIIVFALGVASVSLWPSLPQSLRKTLGLASTPGAAQLHADTSGAPTPTEAGTEKQEIKLTKEQIADAHIDLVAAQPASLARRITVPGSITPAAGRIARVSVKLEGTVAELRKNLGDPVEQNEVLAILESREVADAKSEYLAARLSNELQQELFQRDRKLYEGKVLTEQQFLRSRNLTAQTEMKFNIARQKLFALGLGQDEIAALPDEPESLLRRQNVRSPLSGRIVERKVDLGTVVGRDNLETELFVVVDLARVWVDLAVSPADLPRIKTAAGRRGKNGPISTGLGEIYWWSVEYTPPGEGVAVRDGKPGWQSDGAYLTPEGERLTDDFQRTVYLRTVQDWIIRPQMKSVPGVAGADAIGGYVKQYQVQPDPARLIAYGLSFEQIVKAIEANNVSRGANYIERNGEGYVVRASGRVETLAEIEDIVVATRGGVPVRIKDIAEVTLGRELRTGSASVNGREVVLGTALMLIGGNSRTVAAAADAKIKDINRTLPPSIRAQHGAQSHRTRRCHHPHRSDQPRGRRPSGRARALPAAWATSAPR